MEEDDSNYSKIINDFKMSVRVGSIKDWKSVNDEPRLLPGDSCDGWSLLAFSVIHHFLSFSLVALCACDSECADSLQDP